MQYPTLKDATNHLEDAIITLSGPALAVSGIIAGVDLVTGGHILQQVSWLALVWAITLLLTLDFQVLALGARAHHVYLSDKTPKRKVIEIGLAIILAASISFVSIQMQSIIARVNAVSGLSIDQAAFQLGINTVWLIWERSALVLVLIFMSGWFREEKHIRFTDLEEVKQVSVQPPDEPPSMSDETANRLLGMIAEWQEWRVQVSEQLGVLTEQVTLQPGVQPRLPEHAEMHTPVQEGEQGEQSSQIPHALRAGACVSTPLQLCTPEASTALASTHDTSESCDSEPSDNWPVLAQHAEQGALLSTKNVLPEHGFLAQNPSVQLEKNHVGELSLSSEEECLSLHSSILSEGTKSGSTKTLYSANSSPRLEAGGLLGANIEQKVRILLTQSPDINYSEVSRLVPTTRSTAKKYVDQIRKEGATHEQTH